MIVPSLRLVLAIPKIVRVMDTWSPLQHQLPHQLVMDRCFLKGRRLQTMTRVVLVVVVVVSICNTTFSFSSLFNFFGIYTQVVVVVERWI